MRHSKPARTPAGGRYQLNLDLGALGIGFWRFIASLPKNILRWNRTRLHGDDFDHADPCHGGYDSREIEASRLVEGAEFNLGTLTSARGHQHIDIVRCCCAALLRPLDARRVNGLDNQELALRTR